MLRFGPCLGHAAKDEIGACRKADFSLHFVPGFGYEGAHVESADRASQSLPPSGTFMKDGSPPDGRVDIGNFSQRHTQALRVANQQVADALRTGAVLGLE